MGLHSPDEKHLPASANAKNAAVEKEYASSNILSRHHNRDRTDGKTSTKQLVSNRREMLLLNLSIQTQQEAIDKLHADLKRREQELQDKEDGLAKEQRRFDQLLLTLDREASELASNLEQQQKTKAEKEQQVAALEREISIVSSSIKQQMEKIEQCGQCKQLPTSPDDDAQRDE